MKCKRQGTFFDIDKRTAEISDIEKQLSDPTLWEDPSSRERRVALSRTLDSHRERVQKWQEITTLVDELDTILELARETEDDPSLVTEFEHRLDALTALIRDIRLQLLLSRPHDESNAIITLHAGAGGTESCDWTQMLFRMYSRWAASKGFDVETTDISPGEEAGIRSVTFIIKGRYAYGLLKGESGVHRLVRISPFDAQKRRHTSFASCAVYPEVEESEIQIDEKDIRVDLFGASGHGGQHLQKTESAVRITHIPTGIVVQSQSERSQIKNRAKAMAILKARLYQLRKEQEQASKQAERQEKGEIGWGRQRRNYVFMPYQLVKDTLTGVETGNVEKVIDGDIDPFIQAYLEKFCQ